MNIKKVRMPLCLEWASLVTLTSGDDKLLHYKMMSSWCQEADLGWPGRRMVGGNTSPCAMDSASSSARYADVGFRPVFEVDDIDGLPEGISLTVGTLFMNGQPVRAPATPMLHGDVVKYLPGATLEFREAIDDAAYQIRAIKVGDALIADRVLLSYISWEDIVEAFGPMEPAATCKKSVLEALLAENKENLADPGDVYAQGYHDAIVDVMKKLGFSTNATYFD